MSANLAGKDYFTVDEAASFCCVCVETFIAHADAQELPHGDLWGRRMYRRSDVHAFLERNIVWDRSDLARLAAIEPHRNTLRMVATKLATPAWADDVAIARIYAEARRLSAETGVPHSVDHIVPIRGRNVCGLHVHYNMRVVTRSENSRKGNRHTS